jgi:hypothetical protein
MDDPLTLRRRHLVQPMAGARRVSCTLKLRGRGGAHPRTGAGAGGWQQREGAVVRYWRTGAEQEAVEAAGWEFPVEHAGEDDGSTGLRDLDDDDTGTGRPTAASDGP